MFVSETKITVRYAETDQMGIVHHSNYPIWFEAGRTDFIRQLGMPYSKIEEKGIMLPLIELRSVYKGTARYEDEIIIKTRVNEFTNTRINFYYEIYKNNEPGLITWGETMHVWTNKDLKPVNLKKYFPELFDIMCNAAG